MREIKFRVFDPAQKIFIDPSKFSFNADFSEKLFRGDLKLVKESHSEKCIILQFTGLRDKNGNEIYEGDILTYTVSCGNRDGLVRISNKHHVFHAIVLFEEGCFKAYKINQDGSFTMPFPLSVLKNETIEGNFYQRPDICFLSTDYNLIKQGI